jgi:4-oxalocrotonate tautomerase
MFPRAVDAKERTMPHVIIKMYSGRSEQQKTKLADAITQAVVTTLNHGEDAVSVAIEDIKPDDWVEKVFKPDILAKPKTIYKKPGYDPLS